MSWSTSVTTTKENAQADVEKAEPSYEIGSGAKAQLEIARSGALVLLDAISSEHMTISMSGHAQEDSPGSSTDSISVSISVPWKQ